jgi:hypothetical protein
MQFFRPRTHPLVLLAAVALGGAALVAGVLPSHGQGQPAPPPAATVRVVNVAALASRKTHAVYLEFLLPDGARLTANPRVVVTDPTGKLIEMMATHILQLSPVGKAYIELYSFGYLPGSYKVRAEIDYQDARGLRATAATPPVPFAAQR